MKSCLTFLLLVVGLATAFPVNAKETKDVIFRFDNADPVVFSHDKHLLQYNNNCRICHNAIFNLKERRHYTMAEMEKTKSCGACHTGIKAFSVATEKDCVKCHKGSPKNVTYRMKGATEVVFSHASHLSRSGVSCKSCHNGKVVTGKEKNVTMAEMEKGRSCGACHNDSKAFTVAGYCNNCHKGMKPGAVTFKLEGVADAQFSHKLHLDKKYKCERCHTKLFPYKRVSGKATMADMEKGASCGACHNGKEAITVSGNCATCHAGWKPGVITFKNEAGEVRFSHYSHLSVYKCQDCHTKLFPLRAGVQHTSMKEMETGKSCGGCHNGSTAFTVKDDCKRCHKM